MNDRPLTHSFFARGRRGGAAAASRQTTDSQRLSGIVLRRHNLTFRLRNEDQQERLLRVKLGQCRLNDKPFGGGPQTHVDLPCELTIAFVGKWAEVMNLLEANDMLSIDSFPTETKDTEDYDSYVVSTNSSDVRAKAITRSGLVFAVTSEQLRETQVPPNSGGIYPFLPIQISSLVQRHGNIPRSSADSRFAFRSAHRLRGPYEVSPPSSIVYHKLTHLVPPDKLALFYAVVWDAESGLTRLTSDSGVYSVSVKLVDDSVGKTAEALLQPDAPRYILHLRGDSITNQIPLLTFGDIVRCRRVSVTQNFSRTNPIIDIRTMRKVSSVVMWSGALSAFHRRENGVSVGYRTTLPGSTPSITYTDSDAAEIDRLKFWMQSNIEKCFVWCHSPYWKRLSSFQTLATFGDIVVQVLQCGVFEEWRDFEGRPLPYTLIITDYTTSAPFAVTPLSTEACDYLEHAKVVGDDDSRSGLSVNDWIRLRNMALGKSTVVNVKTGYELFTLVSGYQDRFTLLRLPPYCLDAATRSSQRAQDLDVYDSSVSGTYPDECSRRIR